MIREGKLSCMALAAALAVIGPASADTVATIAGRSVVRVLTVPDIPGEGSTGSGFKIAEGLYITNRHVIERALGGGYSVWVIRSSGQGPPLAAQIRVTSPADIALLSTDATQDKALPLAASVPESGQGVIALGYPHQLDIVMGLGETDLFRPSPPDVTVGALINVADASEGDVTRLLHSANIWPGNSGGPLIDRCGRVAGVNTWIHSDHELSPQSIAISAADIAKFLEANSVEATIDTRICVDSLLSDGPPPDAPKIVAEDDGSGDETIGYLILGFGLAALGSYGAYFLWQRERERKAREASETEARDSDQW